MRILLDIPPFLNADACFADFFVLPICLGLISAFITAFCLVGDVEDFVF